MSLVFALQRLGLFSETFRAQELITSLGHGLVIVDYGLLLRLFCSFFLLFLLFSFDPTLLSLGVANTLHAGGEDKQKNNEAAADDPRQFGVLVLVLLVAIDIFSCEMSLEHY